MSAGKLHESRVWVVFSPRGIPLWSTCAMSGPGIAQERLVALRSIGTEEPPVTWSHYGSRGYKVREITVTWRD